jgi:CheY-like chemotaxis protein
VASLDAATETREVSHLAAGQQVRAVVADDNQNNLDVLRRILERIGVDVVTATNGQETLGAIQASRPDIVLMDIRMPVMDGVEAVRQILEEYGESRPKLVAVSASVLFHESQRYLDAGFDEFIPKPINAGQIYECLAQLLHINYEYTNSPSADLPDLKLPEALLNQLSAAAEIRNVTELSRCLEDVRQVSEEGHVLADRLDQLCQDFNMDKILAILDTVECE